MIVMVWQHLVSGLALSLEAKHRWAEREQKSALVPVAVERSAAQP